MNDVNADASRFGFDQLSDLFLEVKSLTSPSELHGVLCGQLCAGLRPSQQTWLASAEEQLNVADGLTARAKSVLADFYDVVMTNLSSESLSFSLLLPDDDETVGQRTEALGQWCAGFLSGYGMGGIARENMSEESIGVLTDLAQIAQVEAEDLEESEDSERDFFEVCEYVRMATLMLFSEHQKDNADTAKQQGKSRPVH
ncbi:UPF0149 family protein [Sansalvadorimonas sp. 2012CJ34-2]|uniref:UPF0149 family protein n=1 Tax=Parendozoicomonas callyspongiae TaxID=2942213 RepID=A0ABT0PG33_9GAMM|nr:UPF0149 family protein [Sansalvadorimonas sp. 2012CJ34-2]MCL6270280.1 UPF0149 family protein [Sansalvadorimonas sp. 2012CJ34-2]